MLEIYRYTDVAHKCYVRVDTITGNKLPKKYKNNNNYLIIDTYMEQNTQTPELSPMMKQYKELKEKHPDAILLFRCGDFYETYDADASICAAILGITLTKNTKTGVNMAGFPYHALDTYLPKLIRAGKRCAICDQLEDPKDKKLVKRGVTEVITPGEKKVETKEATMVAEEPVKTPAVETPEPPVTETPDSLVAMVREVINTFNGDIPTTLYEYFNKAIGTLEVITIKRSLKLNLSAEDIDCLYNLAVESHNKAA